MSEPTMQSNEVPALFAQAIERCAAGDYRNVEARERLADVAGECCGIHWDTSWVTIEPTAEARRALTDVMNLWDRSGRQNGRLAPLVSLDTAATIKMPNHWWFIVEDEGGIGGATVSLGLTGLPGTSESFRYANPADRSCAECAARVFAHLRHREQGV